jgi:hypothetical protein
MSSISNSTSGPHRNFTAKLDSGGSSSSNSSGFLISIKFGTYEVYSWG